MGKSEFNDVAVLAARRARAVGITQLEIACALNYSQSQVSRVLSGTSKRHTRLLDEICIYVNNNMHKVSSSLDLENSELTDAVASVWDGSSSHAHAIAEVIRSLGAFAKVPNISSSKNDFKEDVQ